MKLRELSQAVKDFLLSHITDRESIITDSPTLSLSVSCTHKIPNQRSTVKLGLRPISFGRKKKNAFAEPKKAVWDKNGVICYRLTISFSLSNRLSQKYSSKYTHEINSTHMLTRCLYTVYRPCTTSAKINWITIIIIVLLSFQVWEIENVCTRN